MWCMWIDERGSEVLGLAECRRLMALAAKQGRTGHLGIPQDGAPLVLPINFGVHGPDLVVRIGDGLFDRVGHARLVALQVDDSDAERPWSVLVRGQAIEEGPSWPGADAFLPQVAEPGRRIIRIRADVVTGRRLGSAPAKRPPEPGAPLHER
jgi:hypothetical protein